LVAHLHHKSAINFSNPSSQNLQGFERPNRSPYNVHHYVETLSCADVVGRQHAVDLDDIELITVDERGGDVRTAAARAPGDEVALGMIGFERDVAVRARFDGVDRRP
jgi:hypothetical protein